MKFQTQLKVKKNFEHETKFLRITINDFCRISIIHGYKNWKTIYSLRQFYRYFQDISAIDLQ